MGRRRCRRWYDKRPFSLPFRLSIASSFPFPLFLHPFHLPTPDWDCRSRKKRWVMPQCRGRYCRRGDLANANGGSVAVAVVVDGATVGEKRAYLVSTRGGCAT